MKNKKILFGMLICVALLLLSIGYADITKSVTLSGSVTAGASDDDFVVEFYASTSEYSKVTHSYSGNTAQMTVANLDTYSESVYAEYGIVNKSTDLKASIDEIIVTLDGEKTTIPVEDLQEVASIGYRGTAYSDYFMITFTLEHRHDLDPYNTTNAQDSVWMTVGVMLRTVPVDTQTLNFTIEVKASAVENK